MTPFICSLFYCYSIFMIQSYRLEIISRLEDNSTIGYVKLKVPFSKKRMVLSCIITTILNYLLFFIVGANVLILINTLPVCVLMFIMYLYRRKIIKLDYSNEVK